MNTTPTPTLPLTVVQGYTRGGKKQLPYVSIWLDQLTHAQIHGPERGHYAAHLVRCVNERDDLLAALRVAADIQHETSADRGEIDCTETTLCMFCTVLAQADAVH